MSTTGGPAQIRLHGPSVRKGTGVWWAERNAGRFRIETISVKKDYQRRGYGKKLFEQVWVKAQNIAKQEDQSYLQGATGKILGRD